MVRCLFFFFLDLRNESCVRLRYLDKGYLSILCIERNVVLLNLME